MEPLSIHSFPKAILHLDGDCFFASCEIALNPKLKGKPVVTGQERGIASSMSYEAKQRGVTRGMPLYQIRKVCPDAVILPSDYETYSLVSKRMFGIVRRYTGAVEEYSIDECFADLTGLRRPLKMTYRQIAQTIKRDLETELGMTFSLGVGPTKVLAKMASKWKKPAGLAVIPARDAHLFLRQLDAGSVWGIGPNTAALLKSCGINSAYDFASRPEAWVKLELTKPFHEIWQELRGISVYPLDTESKHEYQSIAKTKTFTPPSMDREFVFAQLSKNVENACIKIRRHGLTARHLYFFLKTQQFDFRGFELRLGAPTVSPTELLNLIRPRFEQLWRPNLLYRATGVVLSKLSSAPTGQLDLFGAAVRTDAMVMVYKSLDALSAKYGKHTVFLGSSLAAMGNAHQTSRGLEATRKAELFAGETSRKRVGVPLLGTVR